ncbi:DNA-binding protein [Bacillus thuringiensis]|nr:DNA-binding protein [Bacillus thuringiensis]
MNKTELTKVVAEKTELTQKEAVAATQAVLDTIINALANKEKVQILGFSTFEGCE